MIGLAKPNDQTRPSSKVFGEWTCFMVELVKQSVKEVKTHGNSCARENIGFPY